MATITLKYDERNIIAKKTIDYILSLGVFDREEKTALGKPALKAKEEKFLKNLQQIGKDCKGIKDGTNKTKYKSLQSLLDEI